MKTRFLITSLIFMMFSQLALAADAKARLYFKDGSHDEVIIFSYKRGYVTYKLDAKALKGIRKGPDDIASVYFYKVPIFESAMALYKGRKYAEAKVKFLECENTFKRLVEMPNNYSTLAGFYALECSRRLFDLEALSSGMEKFRKDGLTRQGHLQQLEVNVFWEAFRLKDWDRLNLLATEWRERKVTNSQRAQIAYCHGMAYEQLAKKDPKLLSKALNAYNTVLSADFAASVELVVAAATNALQIYAEDSEVELAMKLWETEDENKQSPGYQRLLEASALAKFYDKSGFTKVKALSDDFQVFMKYSDPLADQKTAEDK